jgi:Cu2+-containing amine oxidase
MATATRKAPKPAKKPAKPAKPAAKSAKPAAKAKPTNGHTRRGKGERSDVVESDPTLFAPLTPGEAADALRTLTEDRRLGNMAKVGRYRTIACEPLVVKPPHWMAGHRLARVVVYDYAADRCVDACVDLDAGIVAHLDITRSQPMLSRDEEAMAIGVAVNDDRVRAKLQLGDEALVAMHYWGRSETELAYARRSAAVMFGRPGSHPTVVAVVDLIDNLVTDVVPASQW